MGKKEYRRWGYDEDETEINMEEQLALEDHQFEYEHERDTPTSTTTFSQPNGVLTASHIRKKEHRKVKVKEKVQVFCLSMLILLCGFVAGFLVADKNFSIRSNFNSTCAAVQEANSKFSCEEGTSYSSNPSATLQEINEPSEVQPPSEISADNIRQILRRMSQTVHTAGTTEGKSMSLAIRDLLRSYGLSVRVEQHKTLLTKAIGFSYAEVLARNGSVLFRTTEIGDDVNLSNNRPMIAFSPAADVNGTLQYGNYGFKEDFESLKSTNIPLNQSIVLIRFRLHPSRVAEIASAYGVKALLFYPDREDFGPQLPSNAIRRSSLLTLEQIHDYQKHENKFLIPAHTLSFNDAQQLLRTVRKENWRAPSSWQGGLTTTPPTQIHLRIFNEQKSSTVFNVVGSIPGSTESDRYVIIGCSHDSWSYGAGDPGLGIALLSELARSFSKAVQQGWKPRRSILFISWDANLFASSGISHWIQSHHFEISSRTVAYIDLHGLLRGNETLNVHSSPILREVGRKAISRVIHGDSPNQFNPLESWRGTPIFFSNLVTSDEPNFMFFGNLGIPFIRICLSNSPKGYDYPLFHSGLDTYENFVNFVDPSLNGAETLGKIILQAVLLLAESSVLPIYVEDYVVDIQKAFSRFMDNYQADLHKYNLSIAYLQAAVMRLEVIGDNFRTEMHNRTVINPEYDTLPAPSPTPLAIKSKKSLLHRIINDKLMQIDRTFLSRTADIYKHQVLGFSIELEDISIANNSTSLDHYFPKLKEALECGRRVQQMEKHGVGYEPGIKEIRDISLRRSGSEINSLAKHRRKIRSRRTRSRDKKFRDRDPDAKGIGTYWLDNSICHEWHALALQRIASLTRALDAASAVLQSPLLPEESE